MLTARQLLVYQFIKDTHDKTGVTPTHEQIRVHLGVASKSGVTRHIQCLVERGAITVLPRKRQAIGFVEGFKP